MSSVTTETALYLYGITRADSLPASPAAGLEGADVECIVEDRLAAVVSRIAAARLRPRRANLAAHHQVLRGLTSQQSVLPMRFGTMAGEEELRTLLRTHQHPLLGLLERLEGKVEMGLKVYWDTPNVFEYFVANHRELENLRDQLFRFGHTPSLEEKIELGRVFESLMSQSRQRHTERVVQALAPYCAEISTTDAGDERMVMKLACLVEKDRRKEWEEGVNQVAGLFDNHYCFNYSGPFPPHSFAEVDLTPGY